MNRVCDTCKGTELVATTKAFRFGFGLLSNRVKKETEYFCPGCGQRTTDDPFASDAPVDGAESGNARTDEIRRRRVWLMDRTAYGKAFVSVQFPAIYQAGQNVLLPTFEGNAEDGTLIDRHGNPDLMLEFAEQYFKLYKATMPAGRLPNSLVEIMPALHLLVTAAELGFKALLTRDGREPSGHSLQRLHEELHPAHRDWIDTSFSGSYLNAGLTALCIEPPTVRAILATYDSTYGGGSGVYTDSRYYAEPTTRFKRGNSLHGANLVKSNTPYPIFLPEIVSAQINAYRFFSGHERLRRRGADVQHGGREPGNDNHGEWGVVPSSLGLIVVSVPQAAGISAEGEDLASFEKLLSEHPPGMSADWMYGGNTLLFYEVGEQSPTDGHGTLNGVRCRVWRHQRVGMHARDLYLLADRLEDPIPFGSLSNIQVVRTDRRGSRPA